MKMYLRAKNEVIARAGQTDTD